MVLTRGKPLGYEANGMSFRFTMFEADREIACSISSTALDDLAGKRGTQPSERGGQFIQHREEIERAAARVFDLNSKGENRVPMIHLYAKHFKKLE